MANETCCKAWDMICWQLYRLPCVIYRLLPKRRRSMRKVFPDLLNTGGAAWQANIGSLSIPQKILTIMIHCEAMSTRCSEWSRLLQGLRWLALKLAKLLWRHSAKLSC